MKKPFVFKYQRSLYCAWYNKEGGIGCIRPMKKSGKQGILEYRTSTEAVMRRVYLNRDKWEVMPEYQLAYRFGFVTYLKSIYTYFLFYDKYVTLHKNKISIRPIEEFPSFVSRMLERIKSLELEKCIIFNVGEWYVDESKTRLHWELHPHEEKAITDYALSLLEENGVY